MDDAKDSIRIKTAQTFKTLFKSIKIWNQEMQKYTENESRNSIVVNDLVLEIRLENTHWETILNTLLIHLDDTNQNVQVF
jgi:hypothetical protein